MNYLFKKIIKVYNLNKNVIIKFSKNCNYIFIENAIGTFKLKLSYIYFFSTKINNTLIFLKFNLFKQIVMNFFNLYKKLNFIYFIKLKIKGLGYRIRRVSKYLYYFFFNYTNMYYIHIPKNIIIKWYKKRILLISWEFNLLKLILSTIIILKNLGPYQIRGLKYPKQIILLKKKKKKIIN